MSTDRISGTDRHSAVVSHLLAPDATAGHSLAHQYRLAVAGQLSARPSWQREGSLRAPSARLSIMLNREVDNLLLGTTLTTHRLPVARAPSTNPASKGKARNTEWRPEPARPGPRVGRR